MNYKTRCPYCHKPVKISSRGAIKYMNLNDMLCLGIDCPECGNEILAETHMKAKKRRE